MRSEVSPLRLKAAWVVAVGTDALQILLPTTAAGVFSPPVIILDFLAMAVLSRLVGWHWAFLPSIVVELIPGLVLAPTWTIALAIATRGLNKQAPASGLPKDVTPADAAHTITVEATSSPSVEGPDQKI